MYVNTCLCLDVVNVMWNDLFCTKCVSINFFPTDEGGGKAANVPWEFSILLMFHFWWIKETRFKLQQLITDDIIQFQLKQAICQEQEIYSWKHKLIFARGILLRNMVISPSVIRSLTCRKTKFKRMSSSQAPVWSAPHPWSSCSQRPMGDGW